MGDPLTGDPGFKARNFSYIKLAGQGKTHWKVYAGFCPLLHSTSLGREVGRWQNNRWLRRCGHILLAIPACLFYQNNLSFQRYFFPIGNCNNGHIDVHACLHIFSVAGAVPAFCKIVDLKIVIFKNVVAPAVENE